ncbi:glycosyl hydrolase [Maribacter sp. 2210JD10-5]|uniref:glycosyl hydrolase n=1 Tax=Maribacter sp. 2210JD10-5 TaxID=3386272 RepID=UPI0039BC85B6
MSRILPFLGLLFIFSCSPQELVEHNKELSDLDVSENRDTLHTVPSNTIENRDKASILAYFDSLIDSRQLLVGQHCGDGPDATKTYYDDYINELADVTGRKVGIIGADFGFFPSTDYPVQTLIDHWNNGGLVTVSWHADNPFKEGYDVYWNSVENKEEIKLTALLSDAEKTKAWMNYRAELDKVAGALQKLKEAGVTVIWRPFHEMNGDFFWWGINTYNNEQTNTTDYKALWTDLYNTLRYSYGLDNLLWTYSVIPQQNWNADVSAFYPGSDYVDLVGMDYYGETPSFPNYQKLKSLGKIIVMSESGPSDKSYGNWDMMKVADVLEGKAAYFLQWHSWSGAKVAIKDNKNTIEMMNSDAVITLDELHIPENLQ